jgi:protein-export membrane protein SecD
MRDKRQNIIILVIVALLVGASLFLIVGPGAKTRLGLDLQGGLEVVYKATLEGGGQPSTEQMDKAISIIDKRINGIGVTESQVQQQGTDEISVSLPGVADKQTALKVIGKTAQLKFYDDYETRLSGPAASRKEAVDQALKQPPSHIKLTKDDKKKIASLAPNDATTDGFVIVSAGPGKFGNNTDPVYFVYKDDPAMMGDAVKSARQGYDNNALGSKPDVEIDFTSEGSKQFAAVTKTLADRGALLQEDQTFAIVLDTDMESDPQVRYAENPDGISGGSAIITGNFTVAEAKELALVLNIGALPVTLDPIYTQDISATLGKDSLRQALLAGALGLGLVLLYLLIYYRFLGVIADLALIIYAILLWGVFNAFKVTLTLPGIAGMILTIGVAADANVVIFERIKEEVRHGRTVRSAIAAGYSRGFKTILDANILTLLTALVLFVFATAQPKGFAFTLILGVLVSMFTAVLATRAMLGLLSDFEFFNKATFMGVKPSQIVPDQAETTRSRSARRPTTKRKR